MPLRVAGQYTITSGGSGTLAGGVTGVVGTFVDQSLQGNTDASVVVGDYLAVTLPDQSTWRWRITAINSTSPLNINVVIDDDQTNFPAVFSDTPIIPSNAAIAGSMSSTAEQSFVPAFTTYQIPESIQAGLFAEGGPITASQVINVPAGNVTSINVQDAIYELDVTITNLDEDKLDKLLASGHIFVGNVSNVATGVAMTGHVSINNAGLTTVQSASTTQVGVVELATAAEAVAVTDATRATTPISLADLIFATTARQTYTESNVTVQRTLNADGETLQSMADVLGTLINDLRVKGVLN